MEVNSLERVLICTLSKTPPAEFGIKIVGQKNPFFEKQNGEVAENKGKDYMDSQKQTGKQSGEVVENTYLRKKQTGTKLKTNRAMLLKTKKR